MSTKTLAVQVFDSFAEARGGGNPTGVVLDADSLTDREMHEIAAELNQTTTAFYLENGRHRVRFFTPKQEVDLCGHALLAAVTARAEREGDSNSAKTLEIETQSGVVTAVVDGTNGSAPSVWIQFEPPTYKTYDGDATELSAWLGCGQDGIDDRRPIEIAYTGLHHLLVPVWNLSVLDELEPDHDGLRELSLRVGVETVTPFTLDTVDPNGAVHCRDLCAAIGNPEESASGTSNVALAGYLLRHGLVEMPSHDGTVELIGEQGYEMGRPSQVRTRLQFEQGRLTTVHVGGSALCTLRGEMQLDGS